MVKGQFQILDPTSLRARVAITMTIQEWMEINDVLESERLGSTPYQVRVVLEELFRQVKDTVFYAEEEHEQA